MNYTASWYCKNLGDALLAGAELDRVKTLFQQEYERAGQPAHMAIFIRHESEGQLHCAVKLYFSPAAADVARAVTANRCGFPAPQDLGLLAGPETAWSLLDETK